MGHKWAYYENTLLKITLRILIVYQSTLHVVDLSLLPPPLKFQLPRHTFHGESFPDGQDSLIDACTCLEMRDFVVCPFGHDH